MGDRLRQGLEEAGRKAGVAVQALGEGPVQQPIISENRNIRTARDLATANKKAMLQWSREMLDRGFLFAPAGKMYISLAHTDEDIEQTISAAYDAYRALR